MDNIKVFALLHPQKATGFYKIFSTMLKSQLSLLFYHKPMKVFRSYYLELVIGITIGKSFDKRTFFRGFHLNSKANNLICACT